MLSQAEIKDLINSKTYWTYPDFKLLPDDFRCELIYNQIYMSPSPFFIHQNAQKNLGFLIDSFIHSNDLGILVFAPFDVVLDENNVVQPDLVFIDTGQMKQLKNHFFGAPAIVIEILSESTAKYDRTTKKDLYEKFGVKEYWIVDVYNRCIELFSPDENGKYQLNSIYSVGEILESLVLKGFRMEINAVLPPVE